MKEKYIIDLYTGHEDEPVEGFRRRTKEVINRFHLKNAGDCVLYFVISGEQVITQWVIYNRLSLEEGISYLKRRKQDYPELKIDFNLTYLGEF